MSEVSREEMREMRDTGRRAMEKVADVVRQAAAQSGISRTFARVSKVNGDGTLQLDLGSEAHPMPLYAVRSTTACAAAQPGDTVVVDTYAHVPLATGIVHTAGSAAHLVPPHDASAITSGTIDPARVPIGDGLTVSDGAIAVDNGAYVRLLWSGMTQSSVTLSAPLAGFRAIAVTIGGSDGVDEGTTLVWSPDGKTFDVTAAFVVGTNDFRVMRIRFSANGSRLTPTVVDGQNADGYTSSTAYLHSVVGIV